MDPDGDIPELTPEELATMRPAREPLRPRVETRKQMVSLHLDPEVVEAFKSTGPGWQARINSILALAIRPLSRNLGEAATVERYAKQSVLGAARRRHEA